MEAKRVARQVARVLLALGVLLAGLGAAAAERPGKPADPREVARLAYEEGTKAFNLGDFTLAITHYRTAYNALPDAVFLYNIAQASRLAGQLEQALFFYKSFLRNRDDAPNRAEVERRIVELEATLAQQRRTASAPPDGTVAPEVPSGRMKPASRSQIPSPASAATNAAGQAPRGPRGNPQAARTGTRPRSRAGTRPLYRRWWFWAGVGVVAVGAAAAVAVSADDGDGLPSSHFGNHRIY
ncbi:MAG: hypothetical protein IT370_01975 [Deltaproteobacteria bacterium]|nr:hypothetical protein [Deltaproteobacteria bacterium]